jgi:hypothetical protein
MNKFEMLALMPISLIFMTGIAFATPVNKTATIQIINTSKQSLSISGYDSGSGCTPPDSKGAFTCTLNDKGEINYNFSLGAGGDPMAILISINLNKNMPDAQNFSVNVTDKNLNLQGTLSTSKWPTDGKVVTINFKDK